MKLGIDPGTKNLGYAILDGDNQLVTSGTMSALDSNRDFTHAVDMIVSLAKLNRVRTVGIERYVTYSQALNSNTENVNMLIGALTYGLTKIGAEVILARAIEWKPRVCKRLFKDKGFNNPSKAKKLDKEFSDAAAACIVGQVLKTNHESDSVCLAYYSGVH